MPRSHALGWRGSNDGLWDWELATNRIYYSPRWKSIVGYEDEQIADSTLEWFNRVHPLDLERVRAEISEHLAGKVSLLETEHRMLHSDGTYRWVLTRGLAARDDGERWSAWRARRWTSPRARRPRAAWRRGALRCLTGLPSRALLLDRLGQAVARTKRRPDTRFGVLALKISDFKQVTDGLGCSLRDQLLIAISRRLEYCLAEADTLARTAGAEFIALIDDVETAEDILSLPDRILESLCASFALDDDHQAVVSVMIGVVLSGGFDMSADDLVRNAEIAMYRCRSSGKSPCVLSD